MLLTCLLVLLCSACQGAEAQKSISASLEPDSVIDEDIDKSMAYELLRDKLFHNGFDLSGFDSTDLSKVVIGDITYGGTAAGKRYWRIDQWGCKNNLAYSTGEESGNLWIQSDASKEIRINRESGELSMVLNTSEEYVDENGEHRARQYGENWPCLLLTEFTNIARIGDMEHLFMSVSFRINSVENKMPQGTFDESLHSAQFQWYITPQDYDRTTRQFGDMFWFGMPFYDYRYEEIPEFSAVDGGKNDASGKYIYMMEGTDVFERGSATIGKVEMISLDVLPWIYRAFELGQKEGFLSGVDLDDMVISSTNIGWEVPGTFDIDMDLFDLSLQVVWKK